MGGSIISGLIGAIAAIIPAYFIFRQNDKGNQLKYITEERKRWRDRIRELSVAFMTGKMGKKAEEFRPLDIDELKNIREQIAVRLNPDDDEDNYILCLMDCYIKEKDKERQERIIKTLSVAFASLLKHDWERAKDEAKMESNFVRIIFVFLSLLIASFIIELFSTFPGFINPFCLNELDTYCLHIFWIIFYLLLTLLFYHLLKYKWWKFKKILERCQFDVETKKCCGNRLQILSKYLGVYSRRRIPRIEECKECEKD